MYDNYHYPPGADTADAPWNQCDPDELEFDVTCSQSLSRTVSVYTTDYVPGAEGVDYDSDDEGGYVAIPYHDEPDTSDTNWADAYHENDYHTPLQLLELFKQCLEENMKNGLVFKSPKFTKNLIEECGSWTEDETEYVKEDN